MHPTCYVCGSPFFRRSKLRPGDALYLLTLQLPLRCLVCLKRRHVFVFQLPFLKSEPVRKSIPSSPENIKDTSNPAPPQG